ncbi:UDP-4-amino-4,6-dideoxy-N-acetyl-beta-L-altrosamine N-acetyltransferase [Marinobacter sp. es.042]|uniref:UDP-4-amino-4, 6-dideoxy-N-acetyl-beta-L-altrosamine N-acetyltransferase n=1 Tax=Marinobacter sp. es.042 TaxID=1761794 RepID=UPI000B5004F4|nr:UDP-4-amino-4,6-dideoxy-N-acetyl-beta-L-altrosamine N-acetyltransferase [Marinobacter sp. es.042]SNB54884.1 UDP-4-amino-4,6-dideoxy-N-acetyl-beta-L-altrosamine N-acetyltransferase [Marinobacter sp. es.042]
MTEKDLERILQWRNHSEVRRYMYTTHEICLEEHRKWFINASTNPAIELLIYEKNGEAQGFVNITRSRCSEVADWGFYLSPDAPKGSGEDLGRGALNYAFAQLGLHKVCGQALGFNMRSIAFHKRLGFIEEGRLRDQHFDGNQFHDVVCFGLLNREWQAQPKD